MALGRINLAITGVVALTLVGAALRADDWPQWRGPNRDNKVTGFTAPATWPKTLTQKWKTTVGLGVASPVLVGDKVYTFTRQGAAGDEVISCLDANTGKVLWQDKYPTGAVGGNDRGYPGPRATPVVADGKICTLGVAGVLSCLDANTGKVVWREDTKAWPMFHTASSPLIADGQCIAYTGGRGNRGNPHDGTVAAYDLASGKPKWTWSGPEPGYGSPVLLTVEGVKQIVTPTKQSLVGIGLVDGKTLWEVPYQTSYNSNTPIIDGQTVILAGPAGRGGGRGGTIALKVEKEGNGFAAKQVWAKTDTLPSMYNTPVLKDGLLYGLSVGGARGQGQTRLFCQNAQTGNILWTDPTLRGECGAILDTGSVLVALTSDGNLFAFKPSKTAYEELAKYKVAGGSPNRGGPLDQTTWSEPILAGKRVFVKDNDALTLWAIE